MTHFITWLTLASFAAVALSQTSGPWCNRRANQTCGRPMECCQRGLECVQTVPPGSNTPSGPSRCCISKDQPCSGPIGPGGSVSACCQGLSCEKNPDGRGNKCTLLLAEQGTGSNIQDGCGRP